MQDPEELLDIKQAASFLQVSETSLRRWTSAGRLACLRIGQRRERRFRRADLLAFMENQPASHSGADATYDAVQHAIVGGVAYPLGSHLIGLYSSNEGRTRQAVGFLADGLRPGVFCYLLAEPDARKAIVRQLGQGRAPLQADIEAGRLVLSSYEDTMEEQWAYYEKQFILAMSVGARELRVVGDVTHFARRVGDQGILEYEEGYDRILARRFPVVTLCQYDARHFSGAELLETLRSHADVFRYPVERLLA